MRPPAIRYDLPPDRSARAAWCTAAVLLAAVTGWLGVQVLESRAADAPLSLSMTGMTVPPAFAIAPGEIAQAPAPPAAGEVGTAADPAGVALAAPPSDATGAPAPAEAVPAAGATLAPRTPGTAEIETCGGRWLPLGDDGEIVGLAERVDELKRRVRERMLAALARAPDEGARAVALLLDGGTASSASGPADTPVGRRSRAAGGGTAFPASVSTVSARPGAATAPSAGTGAAASAESLATTEPALSASAATRVAPRADALARLAQSSQNARVYGLALRACGATTSGACQMLSAPQWVRLAPDDAAPWLHAAAAAAAQHDAAALDEAMYRLSLARRDANSDGLALTALRAAPIDLASLPGSAALLADLRAIQAALAPSTAVVVDYCSAEALRDANRWQVCAAIAEMLATRGVAERGSAAALGGVLGWPPERLAELHVEQQAAIDAERAALQPGADPLGCTSARRALAWLRAAAQSGEVDAARQMR